MRSATLFERPRAVSLRLMSSYCRLRFALFTPRGGMCAPPRISYLFVRATAKSGPHGPLRRYAWVVRTGFLAVFLLSVAACGPAAAPRDTPSSAPVQVQSSPPEPGLPTPIPTLSIGGPPGIANPTFVPSAAPPLDAGEIAGMQLAFIRGRSDLRIDASLSRDDTEVVYTTVATDMAAVEAEFQRNFTVRPTIYVFAGTESYTEGFVRIFGYSRATATFVAENSVSFFEPSLRLIAVNWAAVSDRRPVAAIRHELTHLLTLDACAPRCDLVPAWLNEGQARLAEAQVPGGEWRLVRLRYEAASMAATGTLIPLSSLVSQLAWNALTDWAGYYKYQEAARATELLREDIGGGAPMARMYDRIRRGQNVAQAYAELAGRSCEGFVAGLPARMRQIAAPSPGIVTLPGIPEGVGASYLLYGFAPGTTVILTISGPRRTESWPVTLSPFGASFDSLTPSAARRTYTIR